MDDEVLRSIPGYDGKGLAVTCPICHSISCPQTRQQCSCDWLSMKQGEKKNQWVPILKIIGITWWVDTSINAPPSLHPGHLWEALWNTQTLANLGATSTL